MVMVTVVVLKYLHLDLYQVVVPGTRYTELLYLLSRTATCRR